MLIASVSVHELQTNAWRPALMSLNREHGEYRRGIFFLRPIQIQPTFGRWCLARLLASTVVLPLIFGMAAAANAQRAFAATATSNVKITDDARSKAGDIFTERCATCHGADGRGNGPAAANLKPKPIDFHNQNWQRSVTNDAMTKAIIFGGRSVGKSSQMAANPDLENEPAIVAALVEKIRKWGK